MVDFINTAPLYEVWKETVAEPAWQVVEANPKVLNEMMAAGGLDLGFISSHEYAQDPEEYLILADLSISASGRVGSVYLFSEEPISELNGTTVYLSPQSQTSNSLVKIILEEFMGLCPLYGVSNFPGEPGPEERALLAIGDRALRLKNSGRYPTVMDLGEQWHHHTSLPFVFALWAVRREFWETQSQEVEKIHRELKRCVRQGRQELPRICQLAAPRIPMSVDSCFDYLQGIEYDLGPEKSAALELFFRYLIDRGEAKRGALPLRVTGDRVSGVRGQVTGDR